MCRKNIRPILLVMLLFCAGCVMFPYSEDEWPYEEEGLLYEEIARHSDPPLVTAAKANDFRMITNLLLDGADPEVKDGQGKNALWYAFDHGNFEAFKILLESGAHSDFLNYEMASSSYRKIRLYKLAKEYGRFREIRHQGGKADLGLFDAYFSEFSNGYYVAKVEKMFGNMVRKEYARAAGSREGLERFSKKYSLMGKNCYLVTTDGLNIRAGDSTGTKKLGEYIKGERVFARETKGEWIRTDRGWIHTGHTKRIRKNIPVVWRYLREADLKLGKKASPPVKTPLIRSDKTDPKPSETKGARHEIGTTPEKETRAAPPPKTAAEKDRGTATARKELEAILKNPNLSDLEGFINKYRHHKSCEALVDKAKKEYKAVLLKNL